MFQDTVQPVELENLKRVFKWPGARFQGSKESWAFGPSRRNPMKARLDTKKDDKICWQDPPDMS